MTKRILGITFLSCRSFGHFQPRPQGLLLDDFQNAGSSGEDPGKRLGQYSPKMSDN